MSERWCNYDRDRPPVGSGMLMAKRTWPPRACENPACAVTFVPGSHNAKFCDKCRKAGDANRLMREKHIEAERKRREKREQWRQV